MGLKGSSRGGCAVTWAAVSILFLALQFQHNLCKSVYTGGKIKTKPFSSGAGKKDRRSLITRKILQDHWIKGSIVSAKYCDMGKTSCHMYPGSLLLCGFLYFPHCIDRGMTFFSLVIKSLRSCVHKGKKAWLCTHQNRIFQMSNVGSKWDWTFSPGTSADVSEQGTIHHTLPLLRIFTSSVISLQYYFITTHDLLPVSLEPNPVPWHIHCVSWHLTWPLWNELLTWLCTCMPVYLHGGTAWSWILSVRQVTQTRTRHGRFLGIQRKRWAITPWDHVAASGWWQNAVTSTY